MGFMLDDSPACIHQSERERERETDRQRSER
ncbi:unnamed protein product [Spirodela intermedia]|uniref:Uncharacterized protein n=1 Tax=Spirodela intermedia TaxID=51605 RepID=A0A7I8KBJ5_SPIIN|nr:unnamed protein product [Spirodela intermedia]